MVVRFDCRGLGLSDRDRVRDVSLEARLRDVDAVVAKLGLERFALAGMQGGGNLAVAYAVRHPERVSRLVLLNWTPNFSVDSERSRIASLRELLVGDWEVFTENVGGVSYGYNSPYAEVRTPRPRSITQKMAIRCGMELMAEDCTRCSLRSGRRRSYCIPRRAPMPLRLGPPSLGDPFRSCRLRGVRGRISDHSDRMVAAIAEFLGLADVSDLARAPRTVKRRYRADGSRDPAPTEGAHLPAARALTVRELDVLLLVVKGRSNRDRGRLVLSPRTVERHLENLYRKTSTRNRAEAAAYAVANRLA
jgi:pimeloyl-ACP methyl ester carboxylesterase